MKKLCLIDGSGFIFRAYHALPPLYTKDGTPVNAVFGFTKTLLALLEDTSIDYIAVIFDSARKTFRNEIYPEYKMHRPPAPEDLIPQFPLFRQAVEALNIVSVEKEGFEADDIIATYCKQAKEQNIATCIMSSDKDLMQLVSDQHDIHMFDGIKKIKIREKQVIEKFGVFPNQVICAQAIIGDKADNVPGIKGIGVKGATELIQQYGTLEKIYNNIDNISKKSIKEKLIASKDLAFISEKLVTLHQNVPCEIPIKDMILKPLNSHKLCEFLQKLSFNSLAQKIANKYNISLCSDNSTNAVLDLRGQIKEKISVKQTNNNTIKIENTNNLDSLISDLSQNRIIPLILNIDKNGHIDSLYTYDENKHIDYIIIFQSEKELLLETNKLSLDDVLFALKDILVNNSISKIVFNAKKLFHILNNLNLQINSYEDIVLMHYLIKGTLNENLTSEIVKIFQNEFLLENISDQDNTSETLPENCGSLSLELFLKYKDILIQERLNHIYHYIDKPLAESLYKIEKEGILVNTNILNESSLYFSNHISKLEEEIFILAGENFNIGSPKQIGEILFNKLQIPGSKSKTGAWKTDAAILQDLSERGVEIAEKILKWRHFSKLKNTYSDKLITYADNQGRIHCTYSQCLTTTARLSSINPNLQNIPTKTEEGKKIRQAFIAKEEYKLLSLDYSQIELRILAKIANVDNLLYAFQNDIDIHTMTASNVFNIPFEEVTSTYRRRAKAINFGIIYGQTPFGLSKSLGISRDEASLYIEQYFIKYPEIKTYMSNTINYAKQHGYVKTYYDRKCFVENINQKNFHIKSLAERSAINAPIQGTGADIMREATNKVYKYLENNNNANIILQIHDELIIEVKKEEAEQLALNIKAIMETCAPELKLKVDYKIVDSWE